MPASEVATISRGIKGAEDAQKAPPRPKFLMIESDRISPSPLNPRKHFAEDGLAELAESLRLHGMQQPLVVRQHVEDRGTAGGFVSYSIVMGERRWRAAALAGMLTVPAIVRTDLDDLKHAELAMEENVRRRDLTVMEEANGYAKLQELGKTQSEIGQGVGVSQSRIANLLRLRELPEGVQKMIEDGQISTGHGIQLARYKAWPALCLRVAQEIVRSRVSVSQMEKGLQGIGIYNIDALVLRLSAYPYPAFDWKAICPTCPFGAYLKEGNSQAGEHHYCLKPAHAEKLEKEAKAVQREAAAAEAERLRQQALERSRQAELSAETATTKTTKAQAEADAASTYKALDAIQPGGEDEVVLSKVQYGVIDAVTSYSPAECQAGTCPCRIIAFQGEAIVPACADPKRLAKLKQSAEKEKNKDRKVAFDDARTRLSALPWDNQATETQGRRMMAMVAWNFLRNCKSEAKKQVAARLPVTGENGTVRSLLLRTGYEVQETDAFDILAGISPTDLLGIMAEVMLRDDLLARFEYGDTDLAKTKAAWFLSPVSADVSTKAENVGTSAESADDAGTVSDSEPAPHACVDCRAEEVNTFYVDPNGDGVTPEYLGDWVCLACRAKRQAAVRAEQIFCVACTEPLTPGAFDQASTDLLEAGDTVRMSTGELTVRGITWCTQCGPSYGDDGYLLPDPEPQKAPEKARGDWRGGPQQFIAGQRVEVRRELGRDADQWVPAKMVYPNSNIFEVHLDGKEQSEWVSNDNVRPALDPVAVEDSFAEDGWTYTEPPSLDKSFCQSCGVLPVAGAGVYCPNCDPLSVNTREEAVHAH